MQVKCKDEKQILRAIIVSKWKVWNMARLQQHDDVEQISRYKMQVQDYQHMIEHFKIMGKHLDCKMTRMLL
jgi:hypothetical protein